MKVDLLSRLLTDQSKRHDGNIPIQLYAAISESLGLKTQLLNLPISLLGRLKTPSILSLKDGEMCVALASKSNQILLSRPLYGIESYSFDQISELSHEPSSIPVLVVEKTSRTPQRRFDLRWFSPSLKKHKRPCSKFLLHHFVQLFQLMNPLIIQQIIDKVIGQNGINTLPVLAILLFLFQFLRIYLLLYVLIYLLILITELISP